jgi:hypothetical protein
MAIPILFEAGMKYFSTPSAFKATADPHIVHVKRTLGPVE